jgi:hypothetical protein
LAWVWREFTLRRMSKALKSIIHGLFSISVFRKKF